LTSGQNPTLTFGYENTTGQFLLTDGKNFTENEAVEYNENLLIL